jgi:hypothetical protein
LSVIVDGAGASAWAPMPDIGQDKRGPGRFDLAIQPRAPGRYGCLEASRPAEPLCLLAPVLSSARWGARGRCGRRFGSLIAGAAASGCACVAGVTEGRCIARRTAPRRAGRRRCGRPGNATKTAAVARITTRHGNGNTEPGTRCGGARSKKR